MKNNQPKAKYQKVKETLQHRGGVVGKLRHVPQGTDWKEIKAQIQDKLPNDATLWHVGVMHDLGEFILACSPFPEHMQFFEQLVVDIAGETFEVEICQGQELHLALDQLPKNIRDKRARLERQAQKKNARTIELGPARFDSVAALRGSVKNIMKSHLDGEGLYGDDLELITALLDYHPHEATDKKKGMIGIRVDKSTMGDSRSFFIEYETGAADAFSAKKCLDNLDLNPPFV